MYPVIKSHLKNDSASGGAYLLVLVVMITGVSLVSLVQHAQIQRTFALRMRRADVETEAAMFLGLQSALMLVSEHAVAFPYDPFPPETDPEGFAADSGATIRVKLTDAQDRFDVQWLRNQGVPRESFGHLFRAAGLRGNLLALDAWAMDSKPLATVEEWAVHVPEAAEWLAGPLRHDLTVLPVPATGVTPLNVNAVDADRFVRMMGEGLRGWSETVLQMRDQQPLQDLGSVLALLPGPVGSALRPYLDVRSSYLEVWLEVEFDSVVKEGWALIQRAADGKVEVVECRW